jgi:deoxyadenosine/deoxycytidine kinase
MNSFSYESNEKKYLFLEEPVDEWTKIKDKEGQSILQKFYNNQEKYAFSFQMLAYISRLTDLKNAVKYNTTADFKINDVAFSIEGNIGTGKSTLIKHLQKHFKCENHTKKTYSRDYLYDVIVTERSLYSDCYVFAQMLYDDKKIEDVEFQIYKKWFDEFMEELPAMAFIYIRADPIKSFQRVNKRARDGEKCIPLSYLENCHKYHEEWLMNNDKNKNKNDILVIDANDDIIENPELLQTWIKKIEDFVNSIYMRTKKTHDELLVN